jgi:outer membrane protein assembly factor BamC
MHKLKFVGEMAMLGFVVLASGCAYFRGDDAIIRVDTEYDYLDSSEIKPLSLPEGLTLQSKNVYTVPDVGYQTLKQPVGGELSVDAPQVLMARYPGTSMYQQGSEQQLLLEEPIEQSWMLWRDYLQRTGVPVTEVDVESGKILTGWIVENNRVDNVVRDLAKFNEPDKYRRLYLIELRAGPLPKSSVIRVEQLGNQYLPRDQYASWVDNAPLSREAIAFLNNFVDYYGENFSHTQVKDSASPSFFTPIAIEMSVTDVQPVMISSLGFLQTWQQLSDILPTIGFEITDRNQSLGLLETDYSSPSGGLAFWRKSSESESLALDEDTYYIQLGERGRRTSISILDEDNQPVARAVVEKLATLLHKVSAERGESLNERRERRLRRREKEKAQQAEED